MKTEGFYNVKNNQLMYARESVQAPGFSLDIKLKDTYSYPVGGWIYAKTEYEARTYFNFWEHGKEVDWNSFLESLSNLPDLLIRISNSPTGSLIMARIIRLSANLGDWKNEEDSLIKFWNLGSITVTESESLELNKLATRYNIPIRLENQVLVAI